MIVACPDGGTSIEDLAESNPELILKVRACVASPPPFFYALHSSCGRGRFGHHAGWYRCCFRRPRNWIGALSAYIGRRKAETRPPSL